MRRCRSSGRLEFGHGKVQWQVRQDTSGGTFIMIATIFIITTDLILILEMMIELALQLMMMMVLVLVVVCSAAHTMRSMSSGNQQRHNRGFTRYLGISRRRKETEGGDQQKA